MLNYIFFLLFSITILTANINISKGDMAFARKNYIEAIKLYEIDYKNHEPKSRIKLIMSYLKLGDNFTRIRNYEDSLKWYKKAQDLNSKVAINKIAKIYEKQADQFYRIKKYNKALSLYNKALKLGSSHAKKKISKIKRIQSHNRTLKDDTRRVVTKNSPYWTKAIGRIIVPTKLKFLSNKRYKSNFKKCSATLVSDSLFHDSKVVITASHCLEKYNKNAGDIIFIIKSKQGEMLSQKVTVFKDSNFNIKDMKHKSDYAILLLNKKISTKKVTPVLVNKESFYNLQKKYKNSFASLGGFSSDIGEYGGLVTYDPKCKLYRYNKNYGASTCTGFKGASGGPLILTTSQNNRYKYNFVGVVSHFKNKNYKRIFFTPHNIFYKDIIKALKM